jgi:hypothetical protein
LVATVRDAVEDLLAVARDLVLATIVGRGKASERVARRKVDIVGDRPREPAKLGGEDVAGGIEI